jgi:hypothetical protein
MSINTERADYTRWSVPLDEVVVRDICDKFEIPDTHPYCQPNAVVYAAELNEYIKKYFYAMPVSETNYDAVQEKLGDYLEDQEQISKYSDGTATFRCHYNLGNDRIYRLVVEFHEDGRLMKVTTPRPRFLG